MSRSVLATLLLLTTPLSLMAEWHVADGDYLVCDTEAQYRQLLHYSLYGVGIKPTSGCQFAPTGAAVTINHCVESDIILCQFTFTPVSGSSIEGWASKALLREITR